MANPKTLEFCLEDIFDSIDFKKGQFQNADIVISENLRYILKREGFWNKKLKIVFPCGGNQDIDAENGSYQWDYEIFEGFNEIVANGTCYGNCVIVLKDKAKNKKWNYKEFADIDYAEITDMQLELRNFASLTRIGEKVKVILI
jgi:hypothetical protein